MVEQQLHGSHHLLADGVQKGVADVDAETQQEFDDLQILVLDGDEQGRAAEGVDAIDVDLKVNLCLLRKQSCSSRESEFRFGRLIWIRLTESCHAEALMFDREYFPHQYIWKSMLKVKEVLNYFEMSKSFARIRCQLLFWGYFVFAVGLKRPVSWNTLSGK